MDCLAFTIVGGALKPHTILGFTEVAAEDSYHDVDS